jgi:hypothetical protein
MVSAHAIAIPATLSAVALIDGTLAGFRAATGRNGRIDKRAYYAHAMRRGLTMGAVIWVILALVLTAILITAPDPSTRFANLIRAGTAMLWVVGPFAVLVVASLVGYAALPRRPATLLILIGLGPFTLVRPSIAVVAGLAAAWSGRDLVISGCAALAVVGVLAVEPYAHRRWYAQPR